MWEEKRLHYVSKVFSGFAFASEDMSDEGIPILKIGNIQGKRVLKETNAYLPIDKLLPKHSKYYLKSTDILIAMTGAGSVGKFGKMRDKTLEYLVNQRVGIIRPDIKKINPEYLYYMLTLEHFETYLYNIGVGAGQPNISADDIGSVLIKIPDIQTQTRIADILSNYDDLIENNNRRIKLLEKAAQELYKEWFARFRFPNYENTKFVSGLPDGWKVMCINEVCQTIGGGTPSTSNPYFWNNGNIKWVTPTDITNNESLILIDVEKKITKLGLEKSSTKLLPPNSILMTSRASIGYFGIIDEYVCTNQGFISMIPNDRNATFYLLFNLLFRKEEIEMRATGATFKEISKSSFRKMKIVFPSNDVMECFNRICEENFSKIKLLKIQNQNLKKQRDLLLPRLMSGRLEV